MKPTPSDPTPAVGLLVRSYSTPANGRELGAQAPGSRVCGAHHCHRATLWPLRTEIPTPVGSPSQLRCWERDRCALLASQQGYLLQSSMHACTVPLPSSSGSLPCPGTALNIHACTIPFLPAALPLCCNRLRHATTERDHSLMQPGTAGLGSPAGSCGAGANLRGPEEDGQAHVCWPQGAAEGGG